jgi:hypothetical protein
MHVDRIYWKDNVSLRPPHLERKREFSPSPDVEGCLSAALTRDNLYYFSIYDGDDLVGQNLLHGMDKGSENH